ncbi:hypothetical protein BGW36DRAFT_285153 [Talaromyces proteolyticus]|uniref:HIT-type domain-containing protein n=1 Tax=Talaromyces proteolyticus TaxID=1131652 RepID=A0AAD4L2M6_9EURO|nr:uncharacterized protein BGW36DRAFT_285153 [Talaromyces proteolyticus]KAH8704797.1 hypothetical protein BGW36DRAFT_285153 [Talaromyces proteolyticus]
MPLVEVLTTSKSHTTPGWAYVPETSIRSSQTTKSSTGRKRNIREPGGRGANLTSRQNHAIIRHLAELDRENHRENVHIAVPVRKDAVQRDNGRTARPKTTSNVRRILQSQKTFKNYLDDEEAALSHQASVSGTGSRPTGIVGGGAATVVSKVAKVAARRSVTPITKLKEKEKEKEKEKADANETEPKTDPVPKTEDADAMQLDTPVPEPIKGIIKTTHDSDPLLKSYIPLPPSDRLMAALLAEPALTYNAARARPSSSGKPPRYFCTICGYWGKIKCRNCGVRTCGLDCYKVHEDSRCGAFF